ncbi:glycosyltransferase family 2 protein [Pontibacter sp. MBLB2868]|uniref:glycosyltransferase family 2 protein n=1 Tax=Pontibacter sp. MBLB2868 TaxID=3451555 RepID=UPI003F75630D
MNSNSYPSVCIILVNYNGYLDTIVCLESIFSLNYPNIKVIVVDNNSPNHSLTFINEWACKFSAKIKEEDSQFHYSCSRAEIEVLNIPTTQYKLITVQAGTNLGFAGANNIGMRYGLACNCDYFWLLNNDTFINDDTLPKLVQYIQTDKVGILGSKLCYYENPDTIQALGGKFNKLLAVSKHIGEGEKDTGAYSFGIFTDIDYVVGASMFVSQGFLKEVGLLAEEYFLYFEELDWAHRAIEKGWSIGTALESTVFHKEGASAGSGQWRTRSMLSDLLIFRNRFIFMSKFYPQYLILTYLSSILIMLNRFRRGQREVGVKMFRYLLSLNPLSLKRSVAANRKIL